MVRPDEHALYLDDLAKRRRERDLHREPRRAYYGAGRLADLARRHRAEARRLDVLNAVVNPPAARGDPMNEISEISDIVALQTRESMAMAANDPAYGPRQRELARAALAAGVGSMAWFEAEAALAEVSH